MLTQSSLDKILTEKLTSLIFTPSPHIFHVFLHTILNKEESSILCFVKGFCSFEENFLKILLVEILIKRLTLPPYFHPIILHISCSFAPHSQLGNQASVFCKRLLWLLSRLSQSSLDRFVTCRRHLNTNLLQRK